jgi:organic hydroperoxide reductase OsmC/OhrA
MKPLPHVYPVAATMSATGAVSMQARELPDVEIAPPREFDGPGDRWSPESLLVGAIASCFLLTFKAIARASKFEWQSLHCAVDGTLERKDGVTRFTAFRTYAKLTVPATSDRTLCEHMLEKSERGCLVANSLNGERTLVMEIITR